MMADGDIVCDTAPQITVDSSSLAVPRQQSANIASPACNLRAKQKKKRDSMMMDKTTCSSPTSTSSKSSSSLSDCSPIIKVVTPKHLLRKPPTSTTTTTSIHVTSTGIANMVSDTVVIPPRKRASTGQSPPTSLDVMEKRPVSSTIHKSHHLHQHKKTRTPLVPVSTATTTANNNNYNTNKVVRFHPRVRVRTIPPRKGIPSDIQRQCYYSPEELLELREEVRRKLHRHIFLHRQSGCVSRSRGSNHNDSSSSHTETSQRLEYSCNDKVYDQQEQVPMVPVDVDRNETTTTTTTSTKGDDLDYDVHGNLYLRGLESELPVTITPPGSHTEHHGMMVHHHHNHHRKLLKLVARREVMKIQYQQLLSHSSSIWDHHEAMAQSYRIKSQRSVDLAIRAAVNDELEAKQCYVECHKHPHR
jgi:hypothetical protein